MPVPETGIQASQHVPPADILNKPPLLRRIWRTAGLSIWSALLGFVAGSSLVTWAYLQGPFEAGTEEENDMLEEITNMINDYPAMEGLLNDPEWEEWPVASRMVSGDSGKGLALVSGTLTGSKGIIQVVRSLETLRARLLTTFLRQRVFFHRSLGFLTMVIYFGNGVEGWPDVVHGGVLSTMFKEAMEKVASEVFPPGTGDLSKMNIQFIQKVVPGEVYSLSAMPASKIIASDGESVESRFNMQPTERKNSIVAYMGKADATIDQPKYSRTTHAVGYGVFKVRHPFQMDEHGKIS